MHDFNNSTFIFSLGTPQVLREEKLKLWDQIKICRRSYEKLHLTLHTPAHTQRSISSQGSSTWFGGRLEMRSRSKLASKGSVLQRHIHWAHAIRGGGIRFRALIPPDPESAAARAGQNTVPQMNHSLHIHQATSESLRLLKVEPEWGPAVIFLLRPSLLAILVGILKALCWANSANRMSLVG